MEQLAIVLGALLAIGIVAGVIVVRVRRGPTDEVNGGTDGVDRRRPDTALGALRDLRGALGPLKHNRIERRRQPSPLVTVTPERRKKTSRRSG
ncbi:MAG: hypothetical protein ABI699_19890 [Caldimonas sp.]